MIQRYVHISFLFFIITALSGVWMRFSPFVTKHPIPYDHILHAHSHLAMLGWAFLGSFIIFLVIFRKSIDQKKQAAAICFTLFLVSTVMFLAFLYQGYGVFSIIMSTLHIFTEYWAAVFIYKQLKKQMNMPTSAYLFFIGSLFTLILSSIGPYALGFISANGWKESPFFDIAIYFYLHFQYNGWLTMFLIGLFIVILQSKKIQLKESVWKTGFWFYFLSLFPGFILSILWFEGLAFGPIFAFIGGIGQWIGVIIILILCYQARTALKGQIAKLTLFCLDMTCLFLFLKSTMELGLMIPSLEELVYETRHVIIGYLHLTLLGFISVFILTQYQLVGIYSKSTLHTIGFRVFFIGFAINELLLFLASLLDWTTQAVIPYLNEGLLIASILLACGILLIWIAPKNNRLGQI